jgi:hypothetical protein
MGRATVAAASLLVLLQAVVLLSLFAQPSSAAERITYTNYYPNEKMRSNSCKIIHDAVAASNRSDILPGTSGYYVPFIGTSIGRDPQQLVLRLHYSTRDYPVKRFIIVVPERSLRPPHAAIWYEVEHLKRYADNAVIIACTRAPTVAEGWNAGKGAIVSCDG